MNVKRMLKRVRQMGIKRSAIRILAVPLHDAPAKCYQQYLRSFSKIQENQILFYSTPSFSDNAKVLFDYLKQNYADRFHIIWLIRKEDPIPEQQYEHVEFIRADSDYFRGGTFRALKAIAQSRYIFFTHTSPVRYIRKRPGQFVVNLWHGCGYKDIQKIGKTGIEINPFDIMFVPGTIFVKTKSKFWSCPENMIIPLGYPRYNLLFASSLKAQAFCSKLRGSSSKLIAWLPTFRNTGKDRMPEERIQYTFELPLLTNKEELQQLNLFCKEQGVTLCIKRHPMQIRYSCEKNSYSNIRFISNQDIKEAGIELYSIFQYTDALISDYSSISIDYILLDKPMSFVLNDFQEYKNSRGFVFEDPLEYMPGHHLYKFDDLKAFIQDIVDGKDLYREKRAEIMPVVHNPCRNYCKRIWEFCLAHDQEKGRNSK